MSAEGTLEPAGVGQRVVGRWARVASLLLWIMLVVLLGLGLSFRWDLHRTQPLDFDEYHHLHVSWCYAQGLVPYRDFWDNHPPLQHLILAALQPIHGESVDTVFVCRLAMFVTGLGILGVTFGLTRAVFDTATALAAVALLACVQVFTDKTAQVRPDGGLIVFSALTVWLLLRALQRGSLRNTYASCAVAGVAFGLATLFSTKSMMLAVALLIGLLVLAVRRRSALRCKVVLRGAGLAAVGFLAAIAPFGVHLTLQGLLPRMLRFTVLDNVGYPERFSAMRWLWPTWSTPLAVVFGMGVLLVVIDQFRKARHRDASLLLLVIALVLVVEFAWLMPAPYAHSACLPVAFLVIPGGRLLRSAIGLITSPHRSPLVATCGGAAALAMILAGPADSLLRTRLAHQGDSTELLRQLARTQRLLELTGPDDAVFSSAPVAIFRRQACFYPTLFNGVLHRYRTGKIQPGIAEDLRRAGCTLIVETYPPRPIPQDDQEFIRDHFVPSGPSVRVPGQRYSLAQLSDGPVTFDAIAAGVYQVEAAVLVRVDGEPAAGGVHLKPGLHTIECPAEPGPVRIYRRPGQ